MNTANINSMAGQESMAVAKPEGIEQDWDRIKAGLIKIKELSLGQITREEHNAVDLLVSARHTLSLFERLEERYNK